MKPRAEHALPFQDQLHHCGVLVALLKIWELSRAEFRLLVRDRNAALPAVDDADLLIRVLSFCRDYEYGVEVEVLVDVKPGYVELLHLVGRDLGFVEGVEVGGEGAKDQDEEEEEATAAADAPTAATHAVGVGVVLGHFTAIWGPSAMLIGAS